MATTMQFAFNQAGVFAVLRPNMIETARREMERALFAARLAEVRAKVAETCQVSLTVEEAELAVRYLGARRTSVRRGNRLVLPSQRGWALAGRRAVCQ